jgi:hypothetical protein
MLCLSNKFRNIRLPVDETGVKVIGVWAYCRRSNGSTGQLTISGRLSGMRQQQSGLPSGIGPAAYRHSPHSHGGQNQLSACHEGCGASRALWCFSQLQQRKQLNGIVDQDHRTPKTGPTSVRFRYFPNDETHCSDTRLWQ